MNLKSQIPNIITLSNLISGTLAIYATFQGAVALAAYLILIAAVFDFFDGLAARALKVSGELGKQLDSLADLVSFGVAPAFIALSLMGSLNRTLDFSLVTVFALIPLIMVAFSAYRLAKFNIDTRQSEQFIGMPTPANALFWLSLPLIAQNLGSDWLDQLYISFLESNIAIVVTALVLSVLLISELPLLSLKFKNVGIKENLYRYLLIVFSIILLVVFWVKAIPIILILYLVLSIIQLLIKRNHGI